MNEQEFNSFESACTRINPKTRSIILAHIDDTGKMEVFHHGMHIDHVFMAEIVKAETLKSLGGITYGSV